MKNKIGNNTGTKEAFSLMEPLLPEEGNGPLEDLAVELVEKASRLSHQIHPRVQKSIGDLVRSMNCYYSNLIEGHNTHPRDIEKALAKNFSHQAKQRSLQLEAKAHIEVQQMIDDAKVPENFVSEDYLCWIHREFCQRLPEEMLWVENPDTQEKIQVAPGQLRTKTVIVGRHIPPHPQNLKNFLRRFEEVYQPNRLSRLKRILAVAASHHRFLWIHPFFDGNGRVARLLAHAYFKYLELGSGLWSVARGLARNVGEYKTHLETADQPRQGSLDGRGNLSSKTLNEFCIFFLRTCIDQVDYMTSLLDPSELLRRIQIFSEEEERADRFPKQSFSLLREAVLMGSFERGRAAEITGYGERQARTVLNHLVHQGLLISETPKGAVRLSFPVSIVERWFPKLYPS